MLSVLIIAGLLALIVLGSRGHIVVNTGLLTKGLRSEFFERFSAAPTLYQELSTRMTSTTQTEDHGFIGAPPRMREWIGGRKIQGISAFEYSVANHLFEVTMAVKRTELDDDQTGQIRIRLGELAEAAAAYPDEMLASLLENGGTGLGYDAATFFNTAHVVGDSGSLDNAKTVDISTIDATATPAAPTVTAMKYCLQALGSALRAMKDEEGRPLNMSMGGLVLIIPPNHEWAALEALNAAVISGTTNVMASMAQVRVFPWLTSTDRLYLAKVDRGVRPFVFQERDPIEFAAKDQPSDDPVFDRDEYQYGVRWRMQLAYGRFQHIVRMVMT